MSTDLGSSTPTELIPGDPQSLRQTARLLRTRGDALELAAEGLKRIDTAAGWSGQAADQFRRVFDNQPAKWQEAADAFRQAAEALAQYAQVLEWAQGQAFRAMGVWESGAAYHQAAQRMLDDARSEQDDAAQTAARTIGRARDLAPPKPGLLSEIGHDIADAASSAWHGTVHMGEDVGYAIASYGNAAVHDPGTLAAVAGGALLTAASAGGEGLGVVADLTGVGIPVGGALNAASAAGVAAGVTIAGAGVAKMAADADGPDRISKDTVHSTVRGGGGERDIEPSEVMANAQNVYYDENGNQAYVWSQGNGMSQVTIRNPANGNIVTNQWSSDQWIDRQVEKERWYSLGG